jgi:hypothetical protein
MTPRFQESNQPGVFNYFFFRIRSFFGLATGTKEYILSLAVAR